jgi:hypothetical protein
MFQGVRRISTVLGTATQSSSLGSAEQASQAACLVFKNQFFNSSKFFIHTTHFVSLLVILAILFG